MRIATGLLLGMLVSSGAMALTGVAPDGLRAGSRAAGGTATQAVAPAPPPGNAGAAQPSGLPSASEYSATVLPELKGVVGWKTLAQVTPVKQGAKIVPEFSKAILALDQKEGRFQGFMLPLDMGEKQKRFILTAVPPHCSFCLPAGPDAMIEVVAKTPIRYGFEPIVVAGKLAVLKDDPTGVLYRVTDAVLIPASQLK